MGNSGRRARPGDGLGRSAATAMAARRERLRQRSQCAWLATRRWARSFRLSTNPQSWLQRAWLVTRRWAWLAILVLGSVFVGVSSIWPVKEAALTLRLKCDSVAFVLDRDWAWDGRIRDAESAEVSNVSKIETALFAGDIRTESADAWMSLDGGSISLDALDLAKSVRMHMDVSADGGVNLSIEGGRASGQLQALGAQRVTGGTARKDAKPRNPIPAEPPEAVIFRAEGKGVRPATVNLRPHSPAVLRGFMIKELSFRRRFPPRPGIPEWQSTIHGGTALFGDTLREEKLEEGQILRLEGVQGRLVSVGIGKDAIEVLFMGRARGVRTGFDGDEARELKPSYLDSWYQKYTHYVPVAVLVSLWGFAVSLRARPKARLACLVLMALAGGIGLAPRTASADDAAWTSRYQTNVVLVQKGFEPSPASVVGHGFIVGENETSKTLYIVTAWHVVKDTKQTWSVNFCYDREETRKAVVIAENEDLDLAVLRVYTPGSLKSITIPELSIERFDEAWLLGAQGECGISGPTTIHDAPGEQFRFHYTPTGVAPSVSGAPLVGNRGLLGMVLQSTNVDSEALAMGGIRQEFKRHNYPTNRIRPPSCSRCLVTKVVAGLAVLSVGWSAWERHRMDSHLNRYTSARSVVEADLAADAFRSAKRRRNLALGIGAGLAATAAINYVLPYGRASKGSKARLQVDAGTRGDAAAFLLKVDF
jgi:hypothetical protein